MIPLKLKRLEGNDLPTPKRATAYSAGIDFSACLTRESIRSQCIVKDDIITYQVNDIAMVPLGFSCDFLTDSEYGINLVMKLYIRSSVGKSGLVLANGTGIIDADYRGELFACIRNVSNTPIEITHGQRIVQAIIEEYVTCDVIEVNLINDTERGSGGFGSTGIN